MVKTCWAQRIILLILFLNCTKWTFHQLRFIICAFPFLKALSRELIFSFILTIVSFAQWCFVFLKIVSHELIIRFSLSLGRFLFPSFTIIIVLIFSFGSSAYCVFVLSLTQIRMRQNKRNYGKYYLNDTRIGYNIVIYRLPIKYDFIQTTNKLFCARPAFHISRD